ncbi:MAG: hypothetical protein Q9169_005703 [Polycauliona sp. 2 TL-2023]
MVGPPDLLYGLTMRNLSDSSLVPPSNPQPSFLRLPVELRLAIYTMAMGNQRLELKHVSKHIVLQERLEVEVVYFPPGIMTKKKKLVDWNMQLYHLSLPLTCRQIYRETIDLLYSSNTFALDEPHALINLTTCCLPPQRLQAIKNLEVTWKQPDPDPMDDSVYDEIAWQECWTLIATKLKLSSLKVRVRIAFRLLYDAPDCSKSNHDWIKPLLLLRDIPALEIVWTPGYPRRNTPQVTEVFASEIAGRLERSGNRVTYCIKTSVNG